MVYWWDVHEPEGPGATGLGVVPDVLQLYTKAGRGAWCCFRRHWGNFACALQPACCNGDCRISAPPAALKESRFSHHADCPQPCAGAAETMSAKLLLSAQQKLQQAFPCGVAPHSLTTLSTITQQPCQHGVCVSLNGS